MGKAWIFGDNVSTDDIIPGRKNIAFDEESLAKNIFCYAKPDFTENAQTGDIIVADNNFGCGSSREHAVIAIKARGLHVVAKSYGDIFYRNCINNGIMPLELLDDVDIKDGDKVSVDTQNYRLIKGNQVYRLKPLPDFVHAICKAGGLIPYLNKHGDYLV